MSFQFSIVDQNSGIRISLSERRLLSQRSVQVDEWARLSHPFGQAGRALLGMVEQGNAGSQHQSVFLSHAAAAKLSSTIPATIGLPALARLSATLSFEGGITSPTGRINVRWYGSGAAPVLTRCGSVLVWGQKRGRLSCALFDLLEAIDYFNNSVGQGIDFALPLGSLFRRTCGSLRAKRSKPMPFCEA